MEQLHDLLQSLLGWAVDIDLLFRLVPRLWKGAGVTAEIMAASLVLGMALALVLVAMRLSGRVWLNGPAYGYIFLFRGTPLLVQIFLIYYGLGQFDFIRHNDQLWPILREPIYCAIIALSLNTAAYTAEILRGAVLAVPASEIEAARAIGMPGWLILRRVIVPHALKLAIPGYTNEVILLLKGSALVSAITVLDITGEAQRLYARTFRPFEPLIGAGICYLAITYVITRVSRWAEFMTTNDGRRWWQRRWRSRRSTATA